MADAEGQLAPGAQVEVRGEQWLIRSVQTTEHDGYKIRAIGVSEFVHDHETVFFDAIDDVTPLRPEVTELVTDNSPRFRRSRLFLESVFRKTPLPQTERRLALAEDFLLHQHTYQQRPAERALQGLRPRILIADVVGLGKTLEIGLLLAELIRRGRGERILVVTPQHILEQFQHELWTRFALPLVRLDSTGIQRIQRQIPTGRNPFTHFNRAIISVDTLKNAGQYRHHLENIHWDAVVIDESHNLINKGSARNQLARTLAPHTDALILASATPHNGDKKSFAELISLLDPAAIADPENFTADDIGDLYIRRTKVNPEVRNALETSWAERGPSQPVHCPATEPEEAVLAELARTWISPAEQGRNVPGSGPAKDRRLFPYTLLKSFLSSHVALADTVGNRLKRIAEHTDPPTETERHALERLNELLDAIDTDSSAKLAALITQLAEIGVSAGETRAVVFSERVSTLNWLQQVLPGAVGLAPEAVAMMHGSLSDAQQQRTVESFKLESSPVRLLLTGDIASEGVNLHQQCHHLIHYDIPWSLIRIEQRNGRIDRYGQQYAPQFRALLLTSTNPDTRDDTTVAAKLLAREEAAHHHAGTVEPVTGTFDDRVEEDRLTQALLEHRVVDTALAAVATNGDDQLSILMGDVGSEFAATPSPEPSPEHEATPALQRPDRAAVPRLFADPESFVEEALAEILPDARTKLNLRREDTDHGRIIAFDAPEELEHRLEVLPPDYRKALKEAGTDARPRLRITFDRPVANESLRQARATSATTWPQVTYASELHPVLEWLTDKVLVRLGYQQAPVLTARVAEPVYLVQGMYSNTFGRPTVLAWMAVTGLGDPASSGAPTVREDVPVVLAEAGIGPDLSNSGAPIELEPLQTALPEVITAARQHLGRRRETYWDEEVAAPLRAHQARLHNWQQLALSVSDGTARSHSKVQATVSEQQRLLDSLRTTGEPLLRVLAVLVPDPDEQAGAA